MSDCKRIARVGTLAVAFGVWSAAMAHPGLVSADPTAESSSGASNVENPVRGGPGSAADAGMVSSGGSTPSAGEGSVEDGSGSDEKSGPDPAAYADTSDEPITGVVMGSSGDAVTSGAVTSGAVTSGEDELSSDDPQSESVDSTSQQSTAGQVEVVAATPVASAEPSTSAAAPGEGEQAALAAPDLVAAPRPNRHVAAGIAVIPGLPTMLSGDAGDGNGGSVGWPAAIETQANAETLSARSDSVSETGSEPSHVSLRIVTSILAAALAPFVLPIPGSPVQEPTLWVMFAWVRRQCERNALSQRPGLVTAPRQTELVGAAPEAATATVDRIDPVTVDVSAPVSPTEAAVTDTLDVGEGLTYGLAVAGDRLYVLNSSYDSSGNGFVTMIDTATKAVAGSIEVGSMPFALAVSEHTLYVANAGDGSVSVVDVATNRVVGRIVVGATPFGLEVTGDRLYVADYAGTVSVIDLNDNTEITRIPIEGEPFGVATTADRVYVTNYVGGTVAMFDGNTNAAFHTIEAPGANPVGVTGYPYSAAVVGGRLYVVNSATNALTIIDGSVTTVVDVDHATRAVDAIPGGAAPVDVIVRGDRLYVSNVNCGTVAVIDVATNHPVETIRVGIQPGLMTATPDGRTIYVADVMGGTVRVLTSLHPDVDDSAW